MKPMHIEDQNVQQVIERAAEAACSALDEVFPGHDKQGITSNFQGLLTEVIAHMLTGNSILDAKRGHYTALPRLVLDDRAFGDSSSPGTAFLVVRDEAGDWDTDLHRQTTKLLALDGNERRFVQLDASDSLNPYTSFEAAVQGAMRYLKRDDVCDPTHLPRVCPVVSTESGWAPAHNG